MRYQRKREIVEAFQFTDDHVKACKFDGVPLPKGIALMSAGWHGERRELHYYTAVVKDHKGIERPIRHGEWVVSDENAIRVLSPEVFHKLYEEANQ